MLYKHRQHFNHTVTNNDNIKYLLPGPNSDIDKRASAEMTQHLQRELKNVFNEIRCFNGTFSLQIKPDSKPYQAPPQCIAYILQSPFKEELEELQQQDFVAPLGIDETVEWCNSFVWVPNLEGKVRLCLDLARLNQTLIRPVQRGPMLNDIFLKLNNA